MTLYTSDNKLLKHIFGNLLCSAWFAFFGAVYEHFSHEVYSYYMIYAFAIPLVMGALVYSIMALKRIQPDGIFLNFWNSAIVTFTIGSIFKGVLDIYGTTNQMVTVYPVAGGILTACALMSLIKNYEKTKKQAD